MSRQYLVTHAEMIRSHLKLCDIRIVSIEEVDVNPVPVISGGDGREFRHRITNLQQKRMRVINRFGQEGEDVTLTRFHEGPMLPELSTIMTVSHLLRIASWPSVTPHWTGALWV